MKHTYLKLIGLVLFFVSSSTAFAHDIAVKNEDGVTICYNYYNDGTELEVTSSYTKYTQTVNIPETVTYMNRTRKVTSIGSDAFYGCSGLTSVTIPSSVTSIGSDAFDCNNLATVVSLIEIPFAIGDYTFSQNTFMNASLMIPTGTKDKYKAISGWKKFVFIEEKDPSQLSSIESINQDARQEPSVTSRYSLGGEKLSAPQRGINIIKMSDGTTRKEVVR